MLTRIYIDNFRCFTNFEFVPARFQPLLGTNGTGKSALIDVLRLLKDFVCGGRSTKEVFKTADLTEWNKSSLQTFELSVEGNGGIYRYRLCVDHDRARRLSRIKEERLEFDGRPLFETTMGLSKLYRDDFIAGPDVTLDWSQSGLRMLGGRNDNTRLTWFQNWFSNCLFVKLIPSQMDSRSDQDQFDLVDGGVNFASWYRSLVLERIDVVIKIMNSLREILPGFKQLSLTADGDSKLLLVEQDSEWEGAESTTSAVMSHPTFKQRFHQLSDGQRCLIVLYSVLHFCRGTNVTLVLDEPDNFVALREVQPFLMQLQDQVGSGPQQVFLITHHPESMNYMSSSSPVRFARPGNGPVRVFPIVAQPDSGLTLSELVARGWEEDE